MPALKEKSDFLLHTYEARANKLATYANELGSDTKLAGLLGFSPGRLHRIIRKKDAPFTEKLARAIEIRLEKPYRWLDSEASSITNKQFSVPVYFFEDFIDWENSKPAGHYQYITDIPNAFFVKVTSNIYAPKVLPGGLILINPEEKTLISGDVYLISHGATKTPLRAVLRQYEKKKFINIATNEIEEAKNIKVFGKCELIINTY